MGRRRRGRRAPPQFQLPLQDPDQGHLPRRRAIDREAAAAARGATEPRGDARRRHAGPGAVPPRPARGSALCCCKGLPPRFGGNRRAPGAAAAEARQAPTEHHRQYGDLGDQRIRVRTDAGADAVGTGATARMGDGAWLGPRRAPFAGTMAGLGGRSSRGSDDGAPSLSTSR